MTTLTLRRTTDRWPVAVLGGLVVVALIEVIMVSRLAIRQPGGTMVGRDFGLYLEATARWMHGGSFYEPWQLSGPYDAAWGQVFYPPWTLLLLVPGTILWPLWFAIPPVITAWVVWRHRPSMWAWIVIAALVVWFPGVVLPYWAGTPTTWVVMFLALGTRWPWLSALVLLKPSVFPFAAFGIRDRRWWFAAASLGVIALLMWPMTLDWLHAIINARGPYSGLLYSIGDIPLMVVPVIAWLGRTKLVRPRPAPLRRAAS